MVIPTTVTPLSVTMFSPATVSSQFPPVSAAMSTITAPLAICSTMARVTKTGALRPGIWAVVMTTSEAITSAARSSCCFAWYSALCSLA